MYEANNHAVADPAPMESPDALTILRDESEKRFDLFAFRGIIDAKSERTLCSLPARIASGKVVFDFGGVKRINSMGIALLLRCFKKIRESQKAELSIANLNQVNAMLFRMTGIFQLVTSAAEVAEE